MTTSRISAGNSRRAGVRRVRAALADLRTGLQRLYGQDAPALLVYGSQARGEANATSDIDVLLLYRKEPRRGQEVVRLSPILAELNLRYQILISVLPSSQADYEGASGPFWDNVRREGVRVEAI